MDDKLLNNPDMQHLIWAAIALVVYLLIRLASLRISRQLRKLPRSNILFSWLVEIASDVRAYGHGLALIVAVGIVVRDLFGVEVLVYQVVTSYLIAFGAVVAISAGNVLEAWGVAQGGKAPDPRDQQFALTMWPLLVNAVKYLIYFSALVLILGVWGVDLKPIATSIGIVSLVFGYCAQDVIRDLLSGLFIIFERLFYAQSEVEIIFTEGDDFAISGVVERITWRITYVREHGTNAIVAINNRMLTVVRVLKK
jgi:small-conductance mechanosensitive channel